MRAFIIGILLLLMVGCAHREITDRAIVIVKVSEYTGSYYNQRYIYWVKQGIRGFIYMSDMKYSIGDTIWVGARWGANNYE
jgi:hypothetical protein